MKTKYYKFKRYLAVLLCFFIVLGVINQDRQRAEALPVAIPAVLIVGALALGGGVAITNKDKLEVLADNFTRFLDETLPDVASSWHELITKPITTAKIFISEKIRGAFYSFLEDKGWGQKVVTSIPVTTGASNLLNSLYARLYTLSDLSDTIKVSLANFMTKANSGDYVVCTLKSSDNPNIFSFFLVEKDITDVYPTSRALTAYYPFDPIYGVRSDGTVIELPKNGFEFAWRDDGNLAWVRDWSIDIGDIVYNLDRLIRDTNSWDAVKLPPGINVWPGRGAYETGNKDYIVHVTGTSYVNTDIDFTANPDYQSKETAIEIPSINNLTVDEFIDVVNKAIADNMINYGDVITGDLIGDLIGDDVGTGEGSDSNPDEDDNKDPVNNGDFIIPGLGIQWFTDLFDTVKDIPKNVVSGVQKAIDAAGDRVESLIDSIPDGFSKYFTSVTTAIKDIPSTFTDLFTDVKTAILDIPTSFKDYFDSIVEAVKGIDIPVLDAVVVSINNMPNALSSYFNSIVDAIKAIPDAISDYFTDVIQAIKAIPDAFKNWLEQIIDALTELCEVVGQFFVVDTTQINVATADLVDVLTSRFIIFDQLREMAESAKQSFDNAYPIIYMKPPKVIKQFLDKNPGDIYVPDKGMIVLDLSEFAELFKWSRRISTSFFWFLTFRWLLRKFDFEIVITP